MSKESDLRNRLVSSFEKRMKTTVGYLESDNKKEFEKGYMVGVYLAVDDFLDSMFTEDSPVGKMK